MRILLLIFFAQLCMIACGVSKQAHVVVEAQNTNPDIISFLVFKVYEDTISGSNKVELLSKQQTSGTIKKTSNDLNGNLLTLVSYSNGKRIDSLSIEHPLYKKIEYVGSQNQLAVLDTVLKSAEFFVRLQGGFDEVKIFESLRGRAPIQLSNIKN